MLADVRVMMVRELEAFRREIELFPNDELLWKLAPGVTNSAGNLALHICGNLQYFLGAVIGGSGYVRDRDAEFGRRSGTRAELVSALTKTIEVVSDVLARNDTSWLDETFPSVPNNMKVAGRTFLLHLATHLAFHLGQAGYLRRIVTSDPTSAGPLPLTPLGQLP